MNNENDPIGNALGLNETGSSQPKVKNPSKIGDNAAEAVLSIVAYAILIIGILASISVGIAVGSHGYSNDEAGFAIAIGGSILSIIAWAGCMVTVNISNNLRQIKHILNNKQ